MASIEHNRTLLSCLDCGNDSSENSIPSSYTNQQTTSATTRPELKQTEDFLAAELNKLSFQERSEALDDVHCVGEELKETPEMIQQSLVEFERVVQVEKNNVYELACQQNRSYVEDPSFRLMFLRANFFDVNTSVQKMMNLLKCKAKYFGMDKVARDITLDDLNEEDMNLMLSGLYHIQDARDASGRVIIHLFNHMLGRCRPDTLCRVGYYVWMHILIPISEVQMKGTNTVYYDLSQSGDEFPAPRWNVLMEAMQLAVCLPVRSSAIHLCVKHSDLAMNNSIFQFALKKFSQHERVRVSINVGSDMELQYHLKSKGIPSNSLPVDSNGNLRENILNLWFYKHRDGIQHSNQLSGNDIDNFFLAEQGEGHSEVEGQMIALDHPFGHVEGQVGAIGEMATGAPNVDGQNQQPLLLEEQPSPGNEPIHIVGDRDVLLGKGKSYQNHPGNIYFRTFLEPYLDNYDKAPRNGRRQICVNLYHVLRAKGVRFLEQELPGVWVECDSKAAEKKIGQLFRSIRKKK